MIKSEAPLTAPRSGKIRRFEVCNTTSSRTEREARSDGSGRGGVLCPWTRRPVDKLCASCGSALGPGICASYSERIKLQVRYRTLGEWRQPD